MPIFFGIGYAGQRAATAIAKACGGDETVQSDVRKLAAKLTTPLDPVGTFVGMTHELAKVGAAEGSQLGKTIDETLNKARVVERGADLLRKLDPTDQS